MIEPQACVVTVGDVVIREANTIAVDLGNRQLFVMKSSVVVVRAVLVVVRPAEHDLIADSPAVRHRSQHQFAVTGVGVAFDRERVQLLRPVDDRLAVQIRSQSELLRIVCRIDRSLSSEHDASRHVGLDGVLCRADLEDRTGRADERVDHELRIDIGREPQRAIDAKRVDADVADDVVHDRSVFGDQHLRSVSRDFAVEPRRGIGPGPVLHDDAGRVFMPNQIEHRFFLVELSMAVNMAVMIVFEFRVVARAANRHGEFAIGKIRRGPAAEFVGLAADSLLVGNSELVGSPFFQTHDGGRAVVLLINREVDAGHVRVEFHQHISGHQLATL